MKHLVHLAGVTIFATQIHAQSQTQGMAGAPDALGTEVNELREFRQFEPIDLGAEYHGWINTLPEQPTDTSWPGLRLALTGEPFQMDNLDGGLLIPQGNLNEYLHGDALIYTQLSQLAPASIDLHNLGTNIPTQTVDFYSLHHGNQFVGVVTRPPDQSASTFYASLKQQGIEVTPHVSKFNDAIVSSFNQVVLAMLIEICEAPVRPSQVQVTLGANVGARVLMSVEGQVTVTLDLDSNCAELALADN